MSGNKLKLNLNNPLIELKIGLFQREYFLWVLKQEMHRIERTNQPLSMLLLEISKINSSLIVKPEINLLLKLKEACEAGLGKNKKFPTTLAVGIGPQQISISTGFLNAKKLLFDIVNEIRQYGVDIVVCDPLADAEAVKHEYGIELSSYSPDIKVDAVIIAVGHDFFKEKFTLDVLKRHLTNNSSKGVVMDVKGILDRGLFTKSDLLYWRL